MDSILMLIMFLGHIPMASHLVLRAPRNDAVSHAAAAIDQQVLKIFNSFSGFGASKDQEALMDQVNFNKFFMDLKLYDKKFTSTDADIIFNRPEVKDKTERRINYQQFVEALALSAEKKYGSRNDVEKLMTLIAGDAKTVSMEVIDIENTKERVDDSGQTNAMERRNLTSVVKYKRESVNIEAAETSEDRVELPDLWSNWPIA